MPKDIRRSASVNLLQVIQEIFDEKLCRRAHVLHIIREPQRQKMLNAARYGRPIEEYQIQADAVEKWNRENPGNVLRF